MVTPAVMPAFIFTGIYAEFMKGGVLMKSKYNATYGKKITSGYTQSDFGSYHIIDNFRCKSKLTARSGKISG